MEKLNTKKLESLLTQLANGYHLSDSEIAQIEADIKTITNLLKGQRQ